MPHRNGQSGMTIVETIMALLLVTIALMAALVYTFTALQGTRHNKDKDFAIQKAISILEELKGLAENTEGDAGGLLDGYDDGAKTSDLLTIDGEVVTPTEALSDNAWVDGRWKYERQITVQKFPSLEANDVRLVNVRVFGWDQGQRNLLAEVSSVIRTVGDRFPPTQAYDVYCLAIESVPGWWVFMANLVPFVERTIQDLESRNPGLEFRTHWIRTSSYGRDAEYTPYLNQASVSTADVDDVYFYPGTLPSGSAVGSYYVPGHFRSRINIDGTLTNGYDSTDLPLPYALADQYNHAMRYPDEKALFDSRVVAGLEDPAVPTLRLLLEEMYSDPERFENALVINLHGELFPFPPLRNYSDPAKQPTAKPGVRVVTHPEQLRYDNNDDVNLRVYSYLTDPDDVSAPQYLDEPITVLIRGLTSLPGLTVQAYEGGLDVNPVDSNPDNYSEDPDDTADNYPGDMYVDVSSVTAGTLIKLYRSPLRTPCAGGSCVDGGMTTNKRLYGMEYIPTPLASFGRDLDSPGDQTKNTARWRITIPEADLADNTMLTIETRIGTDLSTGTLYPTRNEPTNLSRSYSWRGSDLWIFGNGTTANPPNLPLTERFQMIGDPRHNPYADLYADHDAGNPLGEGYNRYFDDFHNGSDGNLANDPDFWPGFSGIKNDGDPNNDGWQTDNGALEIDVNRVFQLLRSSLLRPKTVYTTLTGWSYYYVGIGNEIGYDGANSFPDSVPVSAKPFTGSGGTRQEMSITNETINGNVGGVKYIRENDSGSYWWSLHWLGELYPDDAYSTWVSDGNLPAGSGSGTFSRVLRGSLTSNLPAGTSFENATRRTRKPGCTTFFSTGTTSSKFHHQGDGGGTGSLVDQGPGIAANYNIAVPDTVSINRPFNINLSGEGPTPDDFQDSAFDVSGLSLSTLASYYDHSGSGVLGSAALELAGTGTDMTYVVVNGISNTALTGSAFIGKWSFLTLLHTFLQAGLSTSASRIPQLPRVEIVQPNEMTDLANPSSVSIQWNQGWRRWDGALYTSAYTSGHTESTPLSYAVLYSDDGGKSWARAQDDSTATPGVRPSQTYLISSTSYNLSTPGSKFPQGSYVLRVEAYRDDIELHYAYHQQKIYIKR